MAQKKTVFLTGASGTMGWEGFKQLYAKKDKFNIVVLLRDSEKNRKQFAPYMNDPSVRIVWGDLKKYESVLECVTGSDYVLHVGGMVSPSADYYPINTIKTNVGAAKNIVKAGLAKKCEIELAYAIGVAKPVSIMVDTFGTGTVSDEKLSEAVNKVFDLRPAAIIRDLELRKPQYRQTAAYGHMGREDLGVAWERTDRVDALLEAVK